MSKQSYDDGKQGVCKLKYYKAFNKGMTCREKKYEIGKEYEEEGGEICHKGMMHFCETPFDTLDYYPLVALNGEFSEFAEVEPLDKVEKKDNKCASRKIRIGEKLSFREFVNAGINSLIEEIDFDQHKIGSSSDEAKIGNSLDFAQIVSSGNAVKIGSSGMGAQIGSSGDEAKIGSSGMDSKVGSSGNDAKIGNSGDGTNIGSSGNDAQIGCTGDGTKIGSSGYGARIISSGDQVRIGSSGTRAKIRSSGDMARIGSSGFGVKIKSFGDEACIGSSGDFAKIKMTGARSIASAIGGGCAISGKKDDWIVLAEWKEDENGEYYPACVKAGKIDGETLKEDTMYMLKDGEFVVED